jgi:hypothetical protein
MRRPDSYLKRIRQEESEGGENREFEHGRSERERDEQDDDEYVPQFYHDDHPLMNWLDARSVSSIHSCISLVLPSVPSREQYGHRLGMGLSGLSSNEYRHDAHRKVAIPVYGFGSLKGLWPYTPSNHRYA